MSSGRIFMKPKKWWVIKIKKPSAADDHPLSCVRFVTIAWRRRLQTDSANWIHRVPHINQPNTFFLVFSRKLMFFGFYLARFDICEFVRRTAELRNLQLQKVFKPIHPEVSQPNFKVPISRYLIKSSPFCFGIEAIVVFDTRSLCKNPFTSFMFPLNPAKIHLRKLKSSPPFSLPRSEKSAYGVQNWEFKWIFFAKELSRLFLGTNSSNSFFGRMLSRSWVMLAESALGNRNHKPRQVIYLKLSSFEHFASLASAVQRALFNSTLGRRDYQSSTDSWLFN